MHRQLFSMCEARKMTTKQRLKFVSLVYPASVIIIWSIDRYVFTTTHHGIRYALGISVWYTVIFYCLIVWKAGKQRAKMTRI
jgi:hypothetical protein